MKNIKLLSIIILYCLATFCQAQNISQWRGNNRDGIYNEKQLLKSWPENGPQLLWSNEDLGFGYGSPAVTSDMIFINGAIDTISYLFAYDLNGKLLWKSPNGKDFKGSKGTSSYPGARSTPTVYNDLVYACTGLGRIACFEKQTGKEKWTVDMLTDFNGRMEFFGYSESLLVDENYVFCTPGGIEINVAALDRLTGKTIWTSKALSDTATYCSPQLIKLPTRNLLVTFTNNFIMGLDAKTGDLLWSQKQENVIHKQHCNTPIFENGIIYYVAGDGNGAVKLELSADGSSIKEIWRNANIYNTFNGFIRINNLIISADRKKKIYSIDIQNGQVVDSMKTARGSIILADDLFYFYSESGDFSLLKLNGTKLEVISKFKIDKGTQEHFAHPVISNGTLYIRHGKAFMAYNIKQE